MAQRNNSDRYDQQMNDQRSGYGYQQDMPQRNDFGGHRGRNEFDRERQFRGMNDQQWHNFDERSSPQSYRMDFDRNRQSYSNQGERSERQGRGFGYQGNSAYDRDNTSGANDMGFRSASSDMPSADRYRTRGGDDDGPGLYGGAEDYGHAGYQERFDYGANRYPNPDMQRGSYTGAGNRGDGAGAAWSYERAEQWNRDAGRGSNGGFGSSERSGMNQWSNSGRSMSDGPHRGKGPKNYSRSDDRIREDVCECLMQDSNVDASEIDVKVSSGEVTLTGTVNSKEEKRRAEDAVERLTGVKDIHNELRVESSSENRSQSMTNSSSADGSSSNGQSSTNRSNTSRNSTRVS